MVDDESSILCHSVGRAGSIYRKNAVWIRDGINCRTIHFAVGSHDEAGVPRKQGLFQSTFRPRVIEVVGQPITICH